MERKFFVDYENVDTKGLDGITRLTPNDTVIIYYSEKHSRMSFGLHRRINESSSTFEYKKITDTSKDALDRELTKDLKQLVLDRRADYYVVSNDKGYIKAINQLKDEHWNVYLVENIKDANDEKRKSIEKVIRKRLMKDSKIQYNLTDEQVSQMVKWIFDATSKSELNKNLQKMFYNQDVSYIFSRLKDMTYNL